jgi:uncharacterized protein
METTRLNQAQQAPLKNRVSLFFLFLLFGLLISVVFSHFRPLFPREIDIPARAALILAFLVVSLIFRRSQKFNRYWLIFFTFFIASFAQALDYYLSGWSLSLLGLSVKTPAGIVMDKLESTFLIVVPIIVLTKLSGNNLASIYLQKGKLRLGLIIGFSVFIVVALISIPWAKWQYQTGDLSLARVVSWIPWILIFVLANGINEELLFRGLFLKKLDPFMGAFLSNLCMAIPFSLLHVGVNYTQSSLMILVFLVPLGLALGYVMQKSNSVLGSWLIHASVDIPVALSLFSTLQ